MKLQCIDDGTDFSPSAVASNATPIMNLPTTVRGGVIRQTVVNDRTHCHADHADDGLDRHTTAAVGVLKAVHPPNTKLKNGNYRVVKDVVCFDPRHYTDLVKRLKLDIMEPPASQVFVHSGFAIHFNGVAIDI